MLTVDVAEVHLPNFNESWVGKLLKILGEVFKPKFGESVKSKVPKRIEKFRLSVSQKQDCLNPK